MFSKKNRDERINEINGVNKLSETLRAKFINFNMSSSNDKITDYFSWEEFKEIFVTTTFQFSLLYKDMIFTIFNCEKYAEFWIDGNEKESYQKYKTPQLLLKNVRIDGKTLQELWNDLKLE